MAKNTSNTEQTCLTTLIRYGRKEDAAAFFDIFPPEEFQELNHRIAANVLSMAAKNGTVFESILLLNAIESAGVKHPERLFPSEAASPSSANITAYAYELQNEAVIRWSTDRLPLIAKDLAQGLSKAHGEDRGSVLLAMLRSEIDKEEVKAAGSASRKLSFISASELDVKVIEETKAIAEGLLLEGVGLLAARMKTGKSWLATQLVSTIPIGARFLGEYPTTRQGVLYLCLEDSEARLQYRRGVLRALPADDLFFVCKMDVSNPFADIRDFLTDHPEISFVCIDTLAQLFPSVDWNDYGATSAIGAGFKRIHQEMGVSFLLVHHSRKSKASDFMDGVLGSTGLTASVDYTASMRRARKDDEAIITIDGRDYRETIEIGLRVIDGIWTYAGSADELRVNKIERIVLDLLRDSSTTLPVHEIHKVITEENEDYKRSTLYVTLKRMVDKQLITKKGKNMYEASAFNE